MATEQDFEITITGVTTEAPAVIGNTRVQGSAGIEAIITAIQDESTPIAETTRMIALEIASAMRLMDPANALDRGTTTMREVNDRIKAYRELHRTLTESDQLSKRDVLNLDGVKFKYVMGQILLCISKAMKDGGVDDNTAINVMRQLGDEVRTSEPVWRVELNKIGTGK